MARHYQDFVGLNTFIYEPAAWDGEDLIENGSAYKTSRLIDTNHLGWSTDSFLSFIPNPEFPDHLSNIRNYKNFNFPFDLPNSASFFNALMSHRGNVYGYPTWRQIRVSHNPLTRKQRKHNVFTYVQQPGDLQGNKYSRYGDFAVFTEPVVMDSNKPLSLFGEVSVYDEELNEFSNRAVELKVTFGNETSFFANKEINEYFDTAIETDENYENLKELYLDGGLEDDGSPIEAFNLLLYRQTVFPKQQYSHLNRTRSRTFFVNTFWREEREDRTKTDVDTGFDFTVPSQSMWPLDVSEEWGTRSSPSFDLVAFSVKFYHSAIGGLSGSSLQPTSSINVGGFNTGDETTNSISFSTARGGSGILMNSYSQFARGFYTTSDNKPSFLSHGIITTEMSKYLYSSPYYSKRHSMNSTGSVVSPSGMDIEEASSLTTIATSSLFEGMAAWDCGRLAGKEPFYDSYEKYATETRLKGKGFSIIPEFRMSSHVEEYLTKGVTEELRNIFELSGGLSQNSTTETENNFYEILSTSDFLRHFDLVQKDHKDFAKESILTLKCKAIKKFLPYEGFYPAQQTVDIAKEFKEAIQDNVRIKASSTNKEIGIQGILEPLFAPGVLFNTIKSGVAVDYPLVLPKDNPVYLSTDYLGEIGSVSSGYNEHRLNYYLAGSDFAPFNTSETQSSDTDRNLRSVWSTRIDFESLVEPERLLSNLELAIQEPHPFGLREVDSDLSFSWGGKQKLTYKKKINNFLAEVAEMFLDNSQFTTIASEEEQSPTFGNAIAGNYYTMRLKMYRSRTIEGEGYEGFNSASVIPPQDLYHQGVLENFTMYSRPSAFGIPVWGSKTGGDQGETKPLDPLWGSNYCFTPPYYYGQAWCDLIFYANETKKYTLEEIMSGSSKYPYQTRFWHPGINDVLRDITGYRNDGGKSDTSTAYSQTFAGEFEDWANSPWSNLVGEDVSGIYYQVINYEDYWEYQHPYAILSGNVPYWTSDLYEIGTHPAGNDISVAPPHHPAMVNYNAMQLDSSVNIFGKGTVRKVENIKTGETLEVASDATVRGKTRWIIQTKFETPMLNFNRYTNLEDNGCTSPQFASESVPRGMWHQYGDIPQETEGVFLQVTDIPTSWFEGALAMSASTIKSKVKSLADLVGFSKEPFRLGKIAEVKEISEAVVAVPFIEREGVRKFFSIPRVDIDSCIEATKREVEPGRFVAGGPPKAGDSVYQMVKSMQKYVLPPSMDFVKHKEIDPFAMYIFEFKHNLTKQDLSDIWQNLPPEIGTKMEEAEASVSHELLAHELLGGGAVVKNGTLDDNAEGNGIPSNIQWMVFKAKKRAKTNYFDKVVAKKGTTEDTSGKQLENASGQTGDDLGVTYNWPYDFFSLVELVKLDAEVTFANIENDDKGQKTIKKIEKKSLVERQKERMKSRNINIARGKGRPKK